ncbi:hypothetical protein [Streptomyces sp. JB150]|uniref:hypothetical protein n=1 Tax=Streptomyces sp. JB150 TaxID=2714844 RepID=UPI001408D701|nr:hypothetical protein [Streptomyces sp. JB150]QIJ65474.1 hypothetical protein G7Z13_28155 [Streptomyces sp. JB150]
MTGDFRDAGSPPGRQEEEAVSRRWTAAVRPAGVVGVVFSLPLTLLAMVGAFLDGGTGYIVIAIAGAAMTAFNVWAITSRRREQES